MNELVAWYIPVLFPSLPLGVFFALFSNYLIYYFFFKSKIGIKLFSSKRHSDYEHSKEDILFEIKNALIPESMLSFLLCLLFSTQKTGPLNYLFSVRWDFSLNEIIYIAMEVIALLVFYEIYYYCAHCFMHKPRFYKIFHSIHHKSLFPTPQTGTSVNLLEAILFYFFFACLIFSPLHIASILIVSLEIKLASLTQHLGHEVFPRWVRRSYIFKYINSTMFHQLHHSDRIDKNLGFQTNILDRYFKTINLKYLEYERNS